MNFKAYLEEKKAIVDRSLEPHFPDSDGPSSDVVASMKYSLLAGGKRLRPILCIAGGEAVGGNEKDLLPFACALELIHTYSLIHDDLPVMDDDDMRRGRPTNHKVFGEAVALLAGDGLLTEAFTMMTNKDLTERIRPSLLISSINMISKAVGYNGMVGGQVADIQSEGKSVNLSTVEFIHNNKTGAMITVSVASGVLLGGGDKEQIEAATAYGRKIGLAFQISDDILDIEGDTKSLGKQIGVDDLKGKNTFPSKIGLEQSKISQAKLVEEAVRCLKIFDNRADPLRQIAHYIIERNK